MPGKDWRPASLESRWVVETGEEPLVGAPKRSTRNSPPETGGES